LGEKIKKEGEREYGEREMEIRKKNMHGGASVSVFKRVLLQINGSFY